MRTPARVDLVLPRSAPPAFVTNRALGGTAELTAAARVAGRPLGLTVGAEGARTRVRYHVFAEPNAAAPGPSAVERFYTPAPTRALTVGVAFRR